MITLKITADQAHILHDCLDAVMQSGQVKNPDAFGPMADLRMQLRALPAVKQELARRDKEAKDKAAAEAAKEKK